MENELSKELKACGEALLRIAAAMEKPTVDEKVDEPLKEEKPLTLENIRSVLAEKSRDGYTAEVRGLLQKHGAGKLSEVSPAEYAVLLKEAEVLGHAG